MVMVQRSIYSLVIFISINVFQTCFYYLQRDMSTKVQAFSTPKGGSDSKIPIWPKIEPYQDSRFVLSVGFFKN